MSSVRRNSRAADLLLELRDEDRLSIDRLALLVGVTADDLEACRDRERTLPVETQLRIAQAIGTRVPRLASRARRLEEQAIAAARLEGGTNAVHLTAPARWW
jgi:plasmid maintenance system antidote protein VapI